MSNIQEQIDKDREQYKQAKKYAPKAPKSKKFKIGYYMSIARDGNLYHIVKNDNGLWECGTNGCPSFTCKTKKQALNNLK